MRTYKHSQSIRKCPHSTGTCYDHWPQQVIPAIIYTLTNGGPNKSTNTLVLYVYTQAFTKNNNMGYATAISEVLFIMILIATVIQQCVMKRTSD